MTGVNALIGRSQFRRQLGASVGLILLVVLVSSAVLTGLVGARRTSTTLDRFRSWSHASDAEFQTEDPSQLSAVLDALRSDPSVKRATGRYLINAFPSDGVLPDFAVLSDPDGVLGTGIDRPRILAGRMPSPDSPDEVLINETTAKLTGLGVGDTIKVSTWSVADLKAIGDGTAGFNEGFNGPTIKLRITGIGRTPGDLPADVRRTSPTGLASPAFLAAHPDVGAWPPAAVVSIRDPQQHIRSLEKAVGAATPPVSGAPGGYYASAFTAADTYVEATQRAISALAGGLVVFAAVALLAGGVVVAQAIARQLAAGERDAATLAALGMTRSRRTIALAGPVILACAIGLLVGVGLSIGLSRLLPIGLASRAEIAPGVWFDPTLTVVGAVVMFGATVAWSLWSAGRLARSSTAGATMTRRASGSARLAYNTGASPAVVTGLRYATDTSRGRGSVRSRSAMAALVIAVGGIVAAGVMVRSSDVLVADPAHWGWNWSSIPDLFGDSDPTPRLAQDRRLAGVGLVQQASVVLNDRDTGGYSMKALRGDPTFTRLSGRLPSGPGEVALGVRTLKKLGVSIGDTVTAQRSRGGPVELTVVGTAVFQPIDVTPFDDGAALTPEGLSNIGQGEFSPSVVLRYPRGARVAELEADLAKDYGLSFNPFTEPQVPGVITYVTQSQPVAVAIGAFFAVLGLLALAHTLTLSARRKRAEMAVLRTMGLKTSGVRTVVLTEALFLVAVGLIIGVPLGLVAGRNVWRSLVEHLGVVADPAIGVRVILIVVPVTIALAVVMSWFPGRSLLRHHPADALRTE